MATPRQICKLGFHSVKGGVGRTTAACMIGIRLAQKGFKVLLVDADFEAPTLDIMLRVNPELKPGMIKKGSLSNTGLDHILKAFDGSWKSVLGVEPLVKNVGKLWADTEWRANIEKSLPVASAGISTILSQLVDEAGNFVGDGEPGRLYVLPCSRDGKAHLSLNYDASEEVDSLDRGLKLAIDVAADAKGADIVLVDLRNGLSDAAALTGRTVHMLITTFVIRYAHILTNINGLRWYSETQRWGLPVVNLYTLDKDVAKLESKYTGFLKESYASGYRRSITKSEWFLALQDLSLGTLPFLDALKFSDFVAEGYIQSDVDPIVNAMARIGDQLGKTHPPLKILAR